MPNLKKIDRTDVLLANHGSVSTKTYLFSFSSPNLMFQLFRTLWIMRFEPFQLFSERFYAWSAVFKPVDVTT